MQDDEMQLDDPEMVMGDELGDDEDIVPKKTGLEDDLDVEEEEEDKEEPATDEDLM